MQVIAPIKTQAFKRSTRSAERSMDEYKEARQRLFDRIREKIEAGSEPSIAAKVFLRIVRSKSPRLRYQVGSGAGIFKFMRRMMPDTFFLSMLGRKMLGS